MYVQYDLRFRVPVTDQASAAVAQTLTVGTFVGVKIYGVLTQLLSGPGGYSWPRLFILLRLVELRRDYV